jgi:hypothetical protein
MPDTIPNHFTTEFSTNWIHRTQQMKARLHPFVVEEDFEGERKRYDRLYKQNSRERTERKAPTPLNDPGMDSRWIVRRAFDLGNLLDQDDAKNLGKLVLPTSDYVLSHSAAYNRDFDDVAWQAALDDALTGEQGTTPSALPAGQKILESDLPLDTPGLTLRKLLRANELLEGADLEDDAPRVLVVSPQQLTNLLNTTEIKSADYNTVKALVNGQIDTFMGFKFVKNLRLRKTGNNRQCVAWVRGAIRVMKGTMMSKIDQRADKSYATQVYSTWNLGAVRVYDEGVVSIECQES